MRKWAYYNEFDAYAAAWLRNLIAAGRIPAGDVDERDICDVQAADLKDYTHCHFFAGIGGWPLALRLAGWPDDRPVWTGSCPCQPFSTAGRRKAFDDERHLWPVWFPLIAQRAPAVVFGEQVASKAGRLWLSGVRAKMEAVGYAVGAADLCSAGVGAPNIRQRLWWVGHAVSKRLAEWAGELGHDETECASAERAGCDVGHGAGDNFWSDFDIVPCLDGKARRIESGTFPLADGIPARVGKLRAYGNAINPWIAKEFVEAYLESARLFEGSDLSDLL